MIKYPKGIKKQIASPSQVLNPKISKSRGMGFEREIDLTNKYYVAHNIAFIYKKPTPIQIVKVDFADRKKTKILEAYFAKPSTTDYNGLYEGLYIDFDAKETNSKTSFPLANIKPHQITHLNNIYENGGIAFLIIYFKALEEYFLLPYKSLRDILKGSKKSISYNDFKESNLSVKFSFNPRIDYLKVIKDNLDKFLK